MPTIKAYHGTNRVFENHCETKNRTTLNDKYQGDWICYVENKDVAWKYADAARNQCFDKDLFISDMQDYFSNKGLEGLYLLNLSLIALEKGSDIAIDEIVNSFALDKKISLDDAYPEFFKMANSFNEKYELDLNDWFDLLNDVEGSMVYVEHNDNDIQDIMNIFNSNIQEIDFYNLELHEKLGFKKSKIEPKVIYSEISYSNPLYTTNREEAKNGRKKGYDIVFYSGEGCVDDEPEILIASPSQVNVIYQEIRKETRDELVDGYTSSFEYIKRYPKNLKYNQPKMCIKTDKARKKQKI